MPEPDNENALAEPGHCHICDLIRAQLSTRQQILVLENTRYNSYPGN